MLIDSNAGFNDGIEKEHKWLRDRPLDANLRPQLREGMTLLPWQELGINFLHHCRRHHGYALLADEMGVGKVTITYDKNTDT
jgi:hypothetical protein